MSNLYISPPLGSCLWKLLKSGQIIIVARDSRDDSRVERRGSSNEKLVTPGKHVEDLAWVTNTVTLIYGERDAILVERGSPKNVHGA